MYALKKFYKVPKIFFFVPKIFFSQINFQCPKKKLLLKMNVPNFFCNIQKFTYKFYKIFKEIRIFWTNF